MEPSSSVTYTMMVLVTPHRMLCMQMHLVLVVEITKLNVSIPREVS